MKLPITDEFLWDLYKLIEKSGNITDFIFQSPTMANYLPGLKNPVFKKYRQENRRTKFRKIIYYLKKNNYIKVQNLKGKEAIMLTKKGIDRALKASFKVDGEKQRKDGKWIMLTFDIPVAHKKARALLRSILHNLGYKIFQQSIWISPFDISEKTEELLQLYSLDQYVRIFLIEEIKEVKSMG